ncbi:hypothetical protein HRI_004055900 [Hibiscus trionum]|uniref:Uncharacterized protein n=1 Tax=Hibiscus trionum TaxID=183268 RepID=A0A9W7MKF1_HIBTR|nr:hypothetical protein HRI_004055900 [Hibiscus trionum]
MNHFACTSFDWKGRKLVFGIPNFRQMAESAAGATLASDILVLGPTLAMHRLIRPMSLDMGACLREELSPGYSCYHLLFPELWMAWIVLMCFLLLLVWFHIGCRRFPVTALCLLGVNGIRSLSPMFAVSSIVFILGQWPFGHMF